MKREIACVFSILILAALVTGIAQAVEEFKVSAFDGSVQIWFEAEAFDERNPEGDRYFKVTGQGNTPKAPDGAFGQAITRAGGSGGMIRWDFDISFTEEGKEGTWYFWARIKNPSNQSDYMLVEGDPNDEIPNGPPFPGGDAVKPFDNADDRIFEADIADWGWWGNAEGSMKALQNGKNTMYVYHRQGNNTAFWDVFMWASNRNYVPSNEHYRNATPMTIGMAVQPLEKLSTTWGSIKDGM